MTKLQNIIAFLCSEYPHKGELTKARLTKLVYLADWFSALLKGRQMSEINWIFNHYGPYVDDVVESARRGSEFSVESEYTVFGSPKYVISFNGTVSSIDLSDDEKGILHQVIERTKDLFFNDFIDYVYSTYPVVSKERYSVFNLPELAQQYKSQNLTQVSTTH